MPSTRQHARKKWLIPNPETGVVKFDTDQVSSSLGAAHLLGLVPVPELLASHVKISKQRTYGLRPQTFRGMAVNDHHLAMPVGDLQLRRVLSAQVGTKRFQETDNLSVFQLGKRIAQVRSDRH